MSIKLTLPSVDLDSQAAYFRTRSAVLIAGTRNAYEYVIGQGIRMGRLKNPPKDWAKCSIRPPRNVSVDIGRNSAAAIAELRAGGRTFQDWYGELGMDWREKLTQRAAEAAFIAKLATDHSVDASLISDIAPEPVPEVVAAPEPDPQAPQNLSVNVEQPHQEQQPINLNVTLQMPEKSGKKTVQFNRDASGQVTNWEVVEEKA